VAFWKQLQDWLDTNDSVFARWLRAAREALLGEMPVLAAGTAMFAIIATVPALAAVVAIYGIAVDPNEIERHLKGLETVMPAQVLAFISSQLERMARSNHGVLGFQIAGSLVGAMISARSSARSLIVSLNRAYRVRELRSALRKFAMTILMGVFTLIGLVVMFAILVALPSLVAAAGLKGYGLVRILRWLVLVSWGLSVWVDNVASYDSVYGAFGSLIVIMLWFYFSTIALIIGGFVNGELERSSGAPAPDRSMY